MRISVSRRQILSIAGPIAFANMIPQLGLLWNVYLVDQLPTQLQAVQSIGLIYNIFLQFCGIGLTNGILVLLSRRSGENDTLMLSKTMGNSILLIGVMSLLMMLLTIWGAPILFGFNFQNGEIFINSIDYVYLRMWGYPFFLASQLFNIFFISIGKTKYLIAGSLANFLCYSLLAPWLIFGWGSYVPALYLSGNAYAFIIGEVVNLIVLLVIFFRKSVWADFPIFKYVRINIPITISTLKTSTPLIIQYLFTAISWLLFFIIIGHTGSRLNLSATSIVRTVTTFASIGVVALANTCNTMTGNLIGQGKQNKVFLLVKKICSISIVYALIVSLILFIDASNILNFFSSEPDIIARGVPSLRVMSIGICVMSLATIFFNAVVGTGNTMINLLLESLSVLAFIVFLFIYFSNKHQPLFVSWIADIVYWAVLLIGSSAYLLFGNWKKKKL